MSISIVLLTGTEISNLKTANAQDVSIEVEDDTISSGESTTLTGEIPNNGNYQKKLLLERCEPLDTPACNTGIVEQKTDDTGILEYTFTAPDVTEETTYDFRFDACSAPGLEDFANCLGPARVTVTVVPAEAPNDDVTCPDGSTVPAGEECPTPPPPPPPVRCPDGSPMPADGTCPDPINPLLVIIIIIIIVGGIIGFIMVSRRRKSDNVPSYKEP